MIPNAGTGIGEGTAPTVCKRPRGPRAARYESHSRSTLTVDRMKSKLPATASSCPGSRELTIRCAPISRASSAFASVEVKAVTSHPHLERNCTAMWPRPPIPMTPTRSVGRTSNCTIGLKTVMPPQKSGPALAMSTPSGNGIAHSAWHRTVSPNPPYRPTMVPSFDAQRLWFPLFYPAMSLPEKLIWRPPK